MNIAENTRVRGVLAVRANLTAAADQNPTEQLRTLNTAVEAFVARNDARVGQLEDALDRLSTGQAALEVGAVGSGDSKRRVARAAFAQFAMTGHVDAMKALLPQAALSGSVDSDPDGGFLVPDEISTDIVARQINLSPLRRLALVRATRANAFKLLVSVGGGTAEWVGERQARPQTDMNQYREITVATHEIYANPALTQTLLDDASVDVAAEVTMEISKDFDIKEGASFVVGDGVNKPRGVPPV